MADLSGDDVRRAVAVCVAALRPRLGEDWTAPVPGLDFTVSSVLAHAAVTPLWYALDAWAGESDSARWELAVAQDAEPSALLAGLEQAGMTCAGSLDGLPAGRLGYHPAGSPDRSGFAAMACVELLVHTDDALRGLGARLDGPRDLAAAALTRLFPAHEPGEDPWVTLLWAHDRPTGPNPPRAGGWEWDPRPR